MHANDLVLANMTEHADLLLSRRFERAGNNESASNLKSPVQSFWSELVSHSERERCVRYLGGDLILVTDEPLFASALSFARHECQAP